MKILLIFASVFGLSMSACPDISDLDVLHPTEPDTFQCAVGYQGPGDDDEIQACNVCPLEGFTNIYVPDGERVVGRDGYYYPMGSLQVLPGCTFTGFSDTFYNGYVYEHEGPETDSYVTDNGDSSTICGYTVYGYVSYQCDCVQELIACNATDQFIEVVECDNSFSEITAQCSYAESIGTLYSADAQDSLGVSDAVAEVVQTKLRDLYSNQLGFSSETEFDWTATDITTFQDIMTENVPFAVPPGFRVVVEQVIGLCDGNESRTDKFRVSTFTKKGAKPEVVEFTKSKSGS